MAQSQRVRIGAGAGYSGDRIPPALDLIERGRLNYIVFECLAERTIALAQQAKASDPELGYDLLLDARMRKVLSACRAHGTRLISNMGAANPLAAAKRTRTIAASLGISGLQVASIQGDDVLQLVQSGALSNSELIETGAPVSSILDRLVSANAYIGAAPIVECLAQGADVVLGGRIADPALFLAPLMYEFGWPADDWPKLGNGILVGHLLECAGQLSGGYFADPPFKNVPGLTNLGFPYAVVERDGTAEFRKVDQTGGMITLGTCKEQLLYEIHDPSRYLTPDVTADFSNVEFAETGQDSVRAWGATGTVRPDTLKVSLGYADGFIGEGQITYAGSGALRRAELALELVKAQLNDAQCYPRELRAEMIGVNSVLPTREISGDLREVRVRVAARTGSLEEANLIGATVESLYTNGPAGGGGVFRAARPVLAMASALIPGELVRTEVEMMAS